MANQNTYSFKTYVFHNERDFELGVFMRKAQHSISDKLSQIKI